MSTDPQPDTSNKDAMRAFVIMPFDDSYGSVYELLIKAPLENAGYRVARADSLLDQQSVLRDIVHGINAADLIVADLSGLNPNVFYELGIAHGLGIPTVLLTQEIDALPFDLRTYKVKQYSVRFDLAPDLAQTLQQIAVEHIAGNVGFGSPVSDFLPDSDAARRLLKGAVVSASLDAVETPPPPGEETQAQVTTDDRGWLDLAAEMASASEEIVPLSDAIARETATIAATLEEHTARLEKLSSLSGGQPLWAAREISRAVAADLTGYAQAVSGPIDDLTNLAGRYSDASLVYLSRLDIDRKDDIERFASELTVLESTLDLTYESMSTFRGALQTSVGMSRDIDKAARQAADEISRLLTSLEYLRAFTARGQSIAQDKLDAHEDEDEDEAQDGAS